MRKALDVLWASIVRTIVPLIAGWIITQLVNLGIPVDDEFGGAINTALVVAFGGVYHLAIRLLETYVSPKFGWLLGLAKSPAVYTPESPAKASVTEIKKAVADELAP